MHAFCHISSVINVVIILRQGGTMRNTPPLNIDIMQNFNVCMNEYMYVIYSLIIQASMHTLLAIYIERNSSCFIWL